MNPLISVIVPCYNQAQYLDECLQSVLDQTYQNWGCIIVNDGSPDRTEEIALQWTAKDPRFQYLKKENGGLSSARNAGIEMAKGEWILPLDCDDKIGLKYIELASLHFTDNNGIIYSEAAFFGILEKTWNLPSYDPEKIFFENQIYCSAFFRKSDWKLIEGYDENLKAGREDWEFWINLLSNTTRKVVRIDYLGFFYRRKEQSMDTVINSDQNLMFNTELYIYNKHSQLYKTFGNPIQNLATINALRKIESQHNMIIESIRKNALSKFLFKIIERL